MHVDDWIDKPASDDKKEENYARFFLLIKRLPAFMQRNFYDFFEKDHKLFCTYAGKRYRCTGASRLGDVWLNKDFDQDHGYTDRVDVTECSDWSDEK